MKKNDLLLIIGTAVFSFLFYKQGAGLNMFIFSLVMPVLLGIYKPESLKNRLWLLGTFLTVLTGFSVFANGTALSIISLSLSLAYLAGVTASIQASPVTAISYASFSCLTSVGFMIADSVERRKLREAITSRKINKGAVITMGIFIVAVVLVFFFLYQDANPIFKEITKFINLDFISFKWVMFTFMGFLIVYGLIYTRKAADWDNYERHATGMINKEKTEHSVNRFLWFEMHPDIERKAGIILFILLNFMLLTINVIDFSILWSGMKLPEGFTFAGYLHKGIYTLIFSCVLAILLILLIFRGKLNFTENNKSLLILAYIWIAQNIFIAISCALRNYIYISSYSLTYKRITIYVLLILLLAGLISTLIKLKQKRNIYYLFRFNSFAFLITFVAVSLFNWDSVITRYNIKNSEFPDIAYLSNLNESGLPYLLVYAETTPTGEKADLHFHRKRSFYTPESFYWQRPTLTDIIYSKTYTMLEKFSGIGWKSYTLSDAMTIRNIGKQYENGTLKQFVINNRENLDLTLLTKFTGLQTLVINNSVISDSAGLNTLQPFTRLEKLSLSGMKLESLDNLPNFENLKYLDISSNSIADIQQVLHFRNLSELDISENPVENIDYLPELQQLQKINLSATAVKDLSVLGSMPNLVSLQLRAMQNADFETLPACTKLIEIDLSDNKSLSKFPNLSDLITGAPELTKVILQRISLSSLSYFSDTLVIANRLFYQGKINFDRNVLAHIQFLDVTGNDLSNLSGIQIFKGLKSFYAPMNTITDIRHIKFCKELALADFSGNPVASLSGLENLTKLKYLKFNQFEFNDIRPLSKLKQIEVLTLARGSITNTETLTQLTQLLYLDLSDTQIPSLDFLEDMQNLEFLNLRGYTGNDLEKLIHCPSLKVVVLPTISFSLKRKLEQEIPQIKIIREYDFDDEDFYLAKYGFNR
jgi:hypothetical protein